MPKVTDQTVLSIILGQNIILVKIFHFSKLHYITFPNCKYWLRFLSFRLPSFQRCHGTSYSSKHCWVWWALNNNKKKGPESISLDLLLPFLASITIFIWPYNPSPQTLILEFYFSSIPKIPMMQRWCTGKESVCQLRRWKRHGFDPWVGKSLWRMKWQPTLLFLPKKSCGQKNLVDYSPWSHKESDMTEYTHTHTFTAHILLLLFFPNPHSVCYPFSEHQSVVFCKL